MAKKGEAIETVRIECWRHFDELTQKHSHGKWLYRGQADASWEITTSLFRSFEAAGTVISHKPKPHKLTRNKHERLLIDTFRENAHHYLSHLPGRKETIDWLAIMQHHGAPTRLLDVTLSPHIAAYFALESGTGDCCVFGFKHEKISRVDDNYKRQLFERNLRGSNAFVSSWKPRRSNERQMAQQGLFLVPSNNKESVSEILANYSSVGPIGKKYVIPGELRYEGLERLRRMNITSTFLFPGLDGFCRSLHFQVFQPMKDLRRVRSVTEE